MLSYIKQPSEDLLTEYYMVQSRLVNFSQDIAEKRLSLIKGRKSVYAQVLFYNSFLLTTFQHAGMGFIAV